MELKHGIEVEKDGKKTVLKEFEVLPATVGVLLRAADLGAGSDAKTSAALAVERIRIKDLPEKVWGIKILEQMSVEDFNLMQKEIENFDANFTFSPPSLRI